MAKAVTPSEDFKKAFGIVKNKAIEDRIVKNFRKILKENFL